MVAAMNKDSAAFQCCCSIMQIKTKIIQYNVYIKHEILKVK